MVISVHANGIYCLITQSIVIFWNILIKFDEKTTLFQEFLGTYIGDFCDFHGDFCDFHGDFCDFCDFHGDFNGDLGVSCDPH